VDSLLEDSWQSEKAALDRPDLILLAMLWKWPSLVLPPRHPELSWDHRVLRPVTHQWWTPDLVIPCRDILLAFR